MHLKKNILIQLYDDSGMISERMVQQTAEFYAGPKAKHTGPMRISFTMDNKDDIEGAIKYLEQLALDAPLKAIVKPGRVTQTVKEPSLDNSLEVLLEDAKKAAKGDQDKFIEYLRRLDFVFLDSDNLLLNIPETYKVKKIYLEKYQWLIRRSKIAKDPRNDKYDPQLFIGISIFGDRDVRMVIYLYNAAKKKLRIPFNKREAMDFTKTNLIKYPHWMNADERLKWGIEHRVLFNNPEKNRSKFYDRWSKDIKVGDELKLKA